MKPVQRDCADTGGESTRMSIDDRPMCRYVVYVGGSSGGQELRHRGSRHRGGSTTPLGEGSGEKAVPPPQKSLEYLLLKWRILVHISHTFLKFCF